MLLNIRSLTDYYSLRWVLRPASVKGVEVAKYRVVAKPAFFQPFGGNERNWIFQNLEFSEKFLEFSQKILDFSEKLLEFNRRILGFRKK